MNRFRVDIEPLHGAQAPESRQVLASLQAAGLRGLDTARMARIFLLEGELESADVERLTTELLTDPVTERATVMTAQDSPRPIDPGEVAIEVLPRPGVMDPVAESTLAELRAEGVAVTHVRTGRRYVLSGDIAPDEVLTSARRVLANESIEHLTADTVGVPEAPQPPVFEFRRREVSLRDLDEAALDKLSRDAHLFLSRAEMVALRDYFQAEDREPTDLELETLAQTWSEHCVHKTLRSAVAYRGTALPTPDAPLPNADQPTELNFENLLRDTIAQATQTLNAEQRGPECLSVFEDNAGVIRFDDEYGVAVKVETHNHPSAIEPYGGAATGIGGVIRDVIGCGLAARPIASTDVFCVAPQDWPLDALPKGVLHPRRVLNGVVRGVADYGNRMGIPTVNGAVVYDARYLGNPLVFAGSVGLIPRDKVQKAARIGDQIVVIGGRTGRDGIHGATFSSAELTDTHADEFSHAVQIGNAITEKRFLDAILQARDADGGCLYTAITDCGAGGLSSAIGEMGEHVGAVVDLEKVPLKYAGLRYDEIWISEAQERMVVAVPVENLQPFMDIMAAEEVEATVVGYFGEEWPSVHETGPRLIVKYAGNVVGDLDMEFLHRGVPRTTRTAEWRPPKSQAAAVAIINDERRFTPEDLRALPQHLARPDAASKAWIIRQYDHEVQGGSVIKPLCGPGRGPSDAAVLQPRLDTDRGVVLGCGISPHLSDIDPYWMAAAAIDEALRNVICVGGDPQNAAILDNFCWGRTDDPRQLGALVRACQAGHDFAVAYGMPFISGKDSLNNEFALDEGDVGPLLAQLSARAGGDDPDAAWLAAALPAIEERVRDRQRLSIPPTLLITATSIVRDVARCITPDLKTPGDAILVVGGFSPIGLDPAAAQKVHSAIAAAIAAGDVRACHDVSTGGWLVAVAEMAIAGNRGVALRTDHDLPFGPFVERAATYVLEVADAAIADRLAQQTGATSIVVGEVSADAAVQADGQRVDLATVAQAWHGV
jgi:phosphoribosylformylglycinamidine synthase II